MKPFRTREQMLDAHELMFGAAGRRCAEIVLRWAETLFAVPLDALNIRIVLAPVELGPYNRHVGYHYGPDDQGTFILGNRHIVELNKGTLVLKEQGEQLLGEDFIIHEMTHARQAQLLRQHGRPMTRGAHRDLGWYSAIAEAAPRYLGVEVPRHVWPRGPRSRRDQGRLTEVEMTHWPTSLRQLAREGDPRLPPCLARGAMVACTDQLMCALPAGPPHQPEPRRDCQQPVAKPARTTPTEPPPTTLKRHP
jgi:hypothetical protein